MAGNSKRPLLITIFAILIFGVGISALVTGTLLAMGKLPEILAEYDLTKEAAGLLFIGIGTANVAMAGGFWDGWKLAWYIGVTVLFLLIVVELASTFLLTPLSLIAIPFNLIVLLYILRPETKAYFRHRCHLMDISEKRIRTLSEGFRSRS